MVESECAEGLCKWSGGCQKDNTQGYRCSPDKQLIVYNCKIGDIAKHIVANTKANKGMNDRLKCPYFKLWPNMQVLLFSNPVSILQ